MVNDVTTELHYDGAWQDITTDVRHADPITITWGREDRAPQPRPSNLKLTIDNRDGRYSPRNPRSPLFGKLGRNTPIRTRLGAPAARLTLPGRAESDASTPDSAGLDVTGDIDVRLDIEPPNWRDIRTLITKYDLGVDQRSWFFRLEEDGALRFWWYSAGTLTPSANATSTVVIPDTTGRLAIRATVDVDNGAGGSDVTFYTAPDFSGPWTQLGDVVTLTSAPTSIFAGTAPVVVGDFADPGGESTAFLGAVFAAEVRDGINGTVVASPDFTTLDPATGPTFTDAQGNVWTLNGTAVITDPSIRMSGEVAAWPPKWDLSGKNVRTPIEAAGIRRRLGQGSPNLRSALYRGMTSDNITTPVGYWPCEDGQYATQLASGIPGHRPMTIDGEVQLAAFSGAPASDAIPTLTTGSILGRVPSYPTSAFLRFMVFANIPDTINSETTIFRMNTTGTAHRWTVAINTSGGLRVRAYNNDLDLILDTSIAFEILGERGLLWLLLEQVGADIDYQIGWMREGSPVIGFAGGTLTNRTKGNATNFACGRYITGDLGGMAIGHVIVLNTNEFWDVVRFVNAWSGETAVQRITRLCAEEDVPLRIAGSTAGSAIVGPQRIDTFLNLLDAAAAAAFGIVLDDHDALRLVYRDGQDLYNQTAALTLDYAAGQVAPELEPVEDDAAVRNDVTVQRPEGSAARAVLETGALSVQPPPDGVGRYDTAETVVVADDAQLEQQASWRLRLGTIDESRYPQITVDLTARPELIADAVGVRAGDRIQITSPPDHLPPDTIDQLTLGATETLTSRRHLITYTCTPASPWTVAVADDDVLGRADTEGAETLGEFTAGTDTSLQVRTTVGPVWTTDPAEFPFEIRVRGVVLNVTSIFTILINNGGMEFGVQAWSGMGATIAHTTAQAHSGTGSLELTPDGGIEFIATAADPIGAAVGVEYTGSAWCYSTAGWTEVLVGLLWRDAAGVTISETLSPLSTPIPAASWTQFVVSGAAPAGTASVSLRVIMGDTPTASDVLYVDDANLAAPGQQQCIVDAAPVNDVEVIIPAGADVALAQPAYAAL